MIQSPQNIYCMVDFGIDVQLSYPSKKATVVYNFDWKYDLFILFVFHLCEHCVDFQFEKNKTISSTIEFTAFMMLQLIQVV